MNDGTITQVWKNEDVIENEWKILNSPNLWKRLNYPNGWKR